MSQDPAPQEKKWCAYCGVWTDHQSGYCVQLLRDREHTLNAEIIRLRAERKRLIELALELVWELQALCKKPIHAEQERELKALQEND